MNMDHSPPLKGFAIDADYAGLLEGRFRLTFPQAELVQRAPDNPIRFQGSAIIEQNGREPLTLTFAALPNRDGARQALSPRSVGSPVRDSELFDFHGLDVSGGQWGATSVSVSGSSGSGGHELLSTLRFVSRIQDIPRPRALAYVRAWIPAPIALPWRGREDRVFEGQGADCRWRIESFERNTQIEFLSPSSDGLREVFDRFLMSISIAAAHETEPCIVEYDQPEAHTRVYFSRHWRGSFRRRPAFPLGKEFGQEVNTFIAAFLNSTKDTFPYVRSAWKRVHQEDVYAESNLVILAVTIETLLRQCFATELAVKDDDFIAEARGALSVLEKAGLSDRVTNFFTASVKNAGRKSPKSALAKLVLDGRISPAHASAWSSLRHPAVHGDPWKESSATQFIEKEFACYGLFQRLIFVLANYDGIQRHYHLPGFPFDTWPPTP